MQILQRDGEAFSQKGLIDAFSYIVKLSNIAYMSGVYYTIHYTSGVYDLLIPRGAGY